MSSPSGQNPTGRRGHTIRGTERSLQDEETGVRGRNVGPAGPPTVPAGPLAHIL
jgi:hypothetical protein